MNYFTGTLIPDAESELQMDFVSAGNGITACWVNFYPAHIALHLTNKQIMKLRDNLSCHLDSIVSGKSAAE